MRPLWIVTIGVLLGRTVEASEEEREVAAARTVLAGARELPPESKADVASACEAVNVLVKHDPDGSFDIVFAVATDPRLHERLRARAVQVFKSLPKLPAGKAGEFLAGVVPDATQGDLIRISAAVAFFEPRFATDAVCDMLEEVLLRPKDNHVLQRTCLRALSRVADLERVKRLLLGDTLREHPYYAIRVDVAAGLASLRVRERRALEILCSLMEDEDPADKQFLVPQEAWLSFWVLTGRTHGIESGSEFAAARAGVLGDDPVDRERIWDVAFLRRGVSHRLVHEVQRVTCSNHDAVTAAAARRESVDRVRNTEALREAAARSRRDIEVIEAEWRAESAK
jgi:hypothetical protein